MFSIMGPLQRAGITPQFPKRLRQGAVDITRHCFSNYIQTFRFSSVIQKALKTQKVSICIAHDVFALRAARDIQKSKGAYFIADMVEIPSIRHRSGQYFRTTPVLGAWLQNHQHRGLLRCAEQITTIGPSMAGFIADNIGRPAVPVRNCQPEKTRKLQGQLRAVAAIPETAKVVCLVNTLAPEYGLETAISAITYLPEDVHLVCIGSFAGPSYQQSIEQTIERAGLGHRIHFLSTREHFEYINLLSSADVGLLLLDAGVENMRLSLPNRFFDYITAGLPIISTNIPDVAGHIRQGGFGICLRRPDGRNLACCIGQCLDGKTNKIMRNNVSRARAAFLWENERATFADILANRHPGQGQVCILANKDARQNLRIVKMAKVAVELGFAVSILSRTLPSQTFRAQMPTCKFIEVTL